jgi:hypothetical protein
MLVGLSTLVSLVPRFLVSFLGMRFVLPLLLLILMPLLVKDLGYSLLRPLFSLEARLLDEWLMTVGGRV